MYKFHFDKHLVSTNLYDHMPNVCYFCFVSCTLFFMYFFECFVCIYMYSVLQFYGPLSLMPVTNYPKAIGGLC